MKTSLAEKNKHITAIAPYSIFPAKMGGQKGIACFYSAFSELLPTTLVSTQNNGSPENIHAEFLPVLSNNKSRYINPYLFFIVNRIIKKNKSTHLILEHPYLGWLGLMLKWYCNIRLVVHSHNIESLRFKSMGNWWWRILWHYEKFTHRHADLNFFITDEDRNYAIEKFRLSPEKCKTITYGFDLNSAPDAQEKLHAKNQLQTRYGISNEQRILLFNGTLDYQPNLDALKIILQKINPLLMQAGFSYKIIICGKNLPSSFNELKDEAQNNIIYAGFVDDINLYFKGADIFINPVIDGGGIKTKLVEALGFNLTCISTREGAIGVPESITNGKLTIIKNNNWNEFSSAILHSKNNENHIGSDFFNYFYWKNIAQKAADAILH